MANKKLIIGGAVAVGVVATLFLVKKKITDRNPFLIKYAKNNPKSVNEKGEFRVPLYVWLLSMVKK